MKRIFTLLFIAVTGSYFSQSNVPPFPEDFGTGGSYPSSFNSVNTTESTFSTDWIIDDISTAPGIPVCNVGGSSGGSKLFGANASSSGIQEVRTNAISTNTYVNIQIGWNALKLSGSSPAVTAEWSRDAGATWNAIAYTNTSGNNTWGVVSPVSLPATANGTIIIVRWYYTANGSGDYVAIDDVKILGTPSPSFYWNGVGALDNVTSWGTSTNGTGSNPPNFSASNQNFFIQNAATAVLTANWTVSGSNSFLNIGDGSVPNQCNLTIPPTFTLTMGTGAALNVNNNSTLTIQNVTFPNIGSVNLGPSSTVDFAQSSNITLWATTAFGNLTLSGTGNKTQPNGNISISGNFIIGSGINYVMVNSGTRTTRISGPITCNGGITTGNSNLTIDGSGSTGTLSFNGATSINNFTFDRAGQALTLGTNLSINGTTSLTNGNLILNDKLLALSGAVNFPASAANGSITSSASGSLSFLNAGAINNELIMDQTNATTRTLNNLTLNRSGVTLSLGNALIVNTASFTNGNLSINGQSLTLSGAVTFPASVSNGVFVGSTTSTLTISGSGAFTNAMFMDQSTTASKSLDMFTLNRASTTMALGNDLIVSGPASFPAGILNLNGTLLTLSGDITFPALVANRGFMGSTTSSLTIDGSGTVSNSLLMHSSNNFLGEFTLDRSGVTVSLGNTLQSYGSINPTLGTLNSNGFLYLRSDASNKGRIGPVGGSVTGNVRVETFAAGGVTDWTNLGPSGINGLTVASWEGQIPMTCLSCPNNEMSAGGYFVSMMGWDETASSTGTLNYVEMSYTDALAVGKGYWTFLGSSLGTTADLTWTVQGTAVQGPIAVNLTQSGPGTGNGFNLISNPYPSPISWDAVLASNPTYTSTLDNAIYVYNPDLGVTTSYAGGTSSHAGGITDAIPMGQGFYVENTATPFTLTFQESNKIKSSAPLLKTAQNVGAVVRLNVNGGGFYDETAIRFHSDATSNYDKQWDAHKLFSSPGYLGYPGVYTKRTTISTRSIGNEDYSINSLPNAISQDAVIPVLVKVYASGQHTITGTDLQNLPNSCVELKDKLLNVTHNLKSGPYVCTISDTTTAPRFELRICADAAMSVNEQNGTAAVQNVRISNDQNGVYVQFSYDKPVKSTISVTNILGQKIMENKSVNTSSEKIYVDAPEKNQLIFITVTSENGKVTKKMIR